MVTGRQLLGLVLCLGLSALGLVWFFRQTDWGELASALSGANYLYLIPALFLTLITYAIRAYRWQLLMNPIKRIRWLHLLSAITIGFMANCVLPARVGELVRASVIGLKEKVSAATALTTVIVERVFDLLAVGVFVAVVLVLTPEEVSLRPELGLKDRSSGAEASATRDLPPSSASAPVSFSVRDLRKWGVGVGIVTAGASFFLFLVKLFPSVALAVGQAPLRLLPRALSERGSQILVGLVAGLQSLQSVGQIFYLAVLSVVHWAFGVFSNIALGWCFGLHLSFAQGSLIFVITALAVALPQGPGFVGVFDYAALVALQMLTVETATAQSYAIVLHFVAVVPITLIGFGFLWWEGLSLRQVTAAQKQS
ncbi:MAG: flippase-like domain-containing protein [Candidatus Omnitrophica bacterium]|nr:flippase-like domain-containing protein [Candidatus Omnitrophota bacterium]